MESFAVTFWVISGFWAIFGAGAAFFALYAFYRLGGWLRHLANEAAAAKRHEEFQAWRAQRAQQQRTAAVLEALEALDNDEVLGLYVQLQSTPYVPGNTKKARKARNERSKIQSQLRRLVPSATAREAMYKGWVGDVPCPEN